MYNKNKNNKKNMKNVNENLNKSINQKKLEKLRLEVGQKFLEFEKIMEAELNLKKDKNNLFI